MLTLFWLLAVVVLLAGHEFLVARSKPARPYSSMVRRLVLLGVLASATVFGGRAHLAERFQAALDARTAKPTPFQSGGDPLVRTALGALQPERPYPSAGTADDTQSWQVETAERLRTLAEYAREIEPPAAPKVLQTEDVDGIRRSLIEFTSYDGTRIPAYVHQPAGTMKRAAVLVIPGHGNGIRGTAGIEPDYQHGLALEFARQGYVTLTPELRGFGLLARDGRKAHRIVALAALSAGSFYKGIVARDLRVALTVLQHWDGVDGSRLAVAGTSLGGELAVFLGGLDRRLRVVISHSYGGVAGPELVSEAAVDDAEQTPHGCHTIPGINRILYMEDWFRLLAPRALQVVRGSGNVPSRERVDVFKGAIADAYTRMGAADRFEFLVEQGRHEFFLVPALKFLARWL